ncbi:MAG: hypothetical protein OEZ48_00525 [Candidatus Bathyarchaeota archaeon]|nr:hypothetical protein [Candidatus Bathyarchaeota archaeon]
MTPIGRAEAMMSDQMSGRNDQKTMMTSEYETFNLHFEDLIIGNFGHSWLECYLTHF